MDEQNIDQPAVTPQPAPQPQPEASVPQATPSADKPKHNTLMAVVAYVLFFVPLLTDAKDDPFVKFHVKQGLVLFLACLAAAVLVRLPVIGWILMVPLELFLLLLLVIGILNGIAGKQKHLPLIGQYGDKFEF